MAADAGEPPYSPITEMRYFFSQGFPLLLANLLEWGLPPLANMFIAGHTPDGVRLPGGEGRQASRVAASLSASAAYPRES